MDNRINSYEETMADTPIDSANQLLNAFVHRKKTRDNTVALNAQRLVNLFRQLSVFKPEFVAEYNKMLLSSSDEVRMMMKDIVGGPTVRQYLDYLQAKSEHLVDEDENVDENTQTISALNNNTGYLPDPDEDKPFVATQGQTGTEIIADLSQSDVLVQMLKMFQENNQKQIETLTDTLKELKNQFKNVSASAQQNQSLNNVMTTQEFMQFQEAQQTAFEQLVRMQNESLSAITTQFAKSLAQREQIIVKEPEGEQTQQVVVENAPVGIETQIEETIADTGISETSEDVSEEKTVALDETVREPDEEAQEIQEVELDSQIVEDANKEEKKEEDIESLPIMATEDVLETEIENLGSDENETLEAEVIGSGTGLNEVETAEMERDEGITEVPAIEPEATDFEIENSESEAEEEIIPEAEPVAIENEIEIQTVDGEIEPKTVEEEDTSVLEESMPIESLSAIPNLSLSLRPVIEQTTEEKQEEPEQIDIPEMPEIESESIDEKGTEPQPVEESALKTSSGMLENTMPPIPSIPPIPHIGMPFGRHIPSGVPRPVLHVPPLPHAPMLGRKPIPAPIPSGNLPQNKMSVGQATKPNNPPKSAEEENIEILSDIEL